MVSKEMAAVIKFLQKMKDNAATTFDVQAIRADIEKMAGKVQPPGQTIFEPQQIKEVAAQWISLGPVQSGAVLLYLHGGGYVAGSVNSHRDLLARLSRATGRQVLAPDYRLAPEHPYPAALNDALTVYDWLLAVQEKSPRDIVLAGDSAGGGLVLALLLKLKQDGRRLPAAAVCLSPWTDLALTGDSISSRAEADPFLLPAGIRAMAPLYYQEADPENPLVSPLYGDFTGLPPLLIHVGSRECLLDDSRRVAERARQAGVPVTLKIWEGLIHVFHLFAAVTPEGKAAIAEIGDFLEGVNADSGTNGYLRTAWS